MDQGQYSHCGGGARGCRGDSGEGLGLGDRASVKHLLPRVTPPWVRVKTGEEKCPG